MHPKFSLSARLSMSALILAFQRRASLLRLWDSLKAGSPTNVNTGTALMHALDISQIMLESERWWIRGYAMICFVFFLLRDIINMCIVACFSLFLFIRRGHGIDWPCQALVPRQNRSNETWLALQKWGCITVVLCSDRIMITYDQRSYVYMMYILLYNIYIYVYIMIRYDTVV